MSPLVGRIAGGWGCPVVDRCALRLVGGLLGLFHTVVVIVLG